VVLPRFERLCVDLKYGLSSGPFGWVKTGGLKSSSMFV
jgi:hypothetical protein